MASKDLVVTVDRDDWRALKDAAECAGMSVEAYVSWGIRVLALQARPGRSVRRDGVVPRVRGRSRQPADESESAAWTETFSERLSCRVARGAD
ncbi:hypothetical protein [Nocardia sp. NPDC004722]